ncbi:MAG: hypothetical protein ACOCQD_01820 [archaeon]
MRKGIGGMAIALVVVALLVATAIGTWGVSQLSARPTERVPTDEYDGEFDDGGVPEAAGGDLQVQTGYGESDDLANMTLNTTLGIDENVTKGKTMLLAYTFEVGGDAEDFEAEATFDPDSDLDSTINLKDAYLASGDDDDETISGLTKEANGEVDQDDEEFEIQKSTIRDGDYVVVVEAEVTSPSGDDIGDSLYDVEMELDGDDVEDMNVFIKG